MHTIAWVAFCAFYGSDLGAENLAAVGSFGFAYLSVIVLEPITDLAVLAIAKALEPSAKNPIFYNRLQHSAT